MRRADGALTLVAVLLGLALAGAARGEEPAPDAGAAPEPGPTLEERVAELEAALEERSDELTGSLGQWTERVRLGGSSSGGYFHGGEPAPYGDDGFQAWDARFFIDAELLRETSLRRAPLVKNVGLAFEWNLVRVGDLANDVGELYVDFQGIGGSSWANAQVGRFQIPVGESYLRYSRGARENPFLTHAVGGPWFWDEGVRLYGSGFGGRFAYVASVSNGETPFNVAAGDGVQGTLKLSVQPRPWLKLSASGLVSGEIGSAGEPASGALWLGETWATAFGSESSVPSFVDGLPTPAGPNVLDGTWLAGVDAVATPWRHVRSWVAWGRYAIDSAGPSLYDRTLDYWIAELVLGGGLVTPWLEPLYLGLRTNRLSTNDGGRGYLLDYRYEDSLGYNAKALTEHAVVLGWRLGKYVVLRAEYDLRRVDLVRGVTPEIAARADDAHGFAFNVGAHF
jgi:hypothetical protein